MNYQQLTLKVQLNRALAQAGARRIPIQRQAIDANGVPQGEAQIVGCLYGIDYRSQATGGGLHIDLPGVVIGGDNARRYVGIRQHGKPPAKGDKLMISTDGVEILQVDCQMGVVYQLTLGGD